MSALPRKGERYKHARLRGTWTVSKCGPKWITLKSSLCLADQRIPTAGWSRVHAS